MADYVWPAEVAPYAMSFYLQPHTGGTESPFSRQRKVYGLSAPRWVARMAFRGGYDGETGTDAYGPALDALLARLKGGQNRAGFYDFRRPVMRGAGGVGNLAASAGATSIVLTGIAPGATVLAGDYLGGDGRSHIIAADSRVAGDGTATVEFEPPLSAGIDADAAVYGNPLSWFRLTGDDAGSNFTEVGGLSSYDLDFVEDPLNAPLVFVPDYTLTIGGITILVADDTVGMD